MKKIRVVLSPEAQEVYNYLNEQASTSKTERTILNAVNKKANLIKVNHHYGKPIAKKLMHCSESSFPHFSVEMNRMRLKGAS